MKNVVILGSTGSIGTSALDVIGQHPDKFQVLALVAGGNIERLLEQIQRFSPKFVVVKDEAKAKELRETLGRLPRFARDDIRISFGIEGSVEAATLPEADIVLSAIVGASGLKPTYAAIQANKIIALANKESLVAAGPVMTSALKKSKAKLIPVDSEHSAIYQTLHGEEREVRRLILTASGGPFRKKTLKELETVTVDEALKHPNWSMGSKITIDSATFMNKGLEVIEARWLFDFPLSKIDVLIHPQSIIHSMVEYIDGSTLAQMGPPDMRTPIAYALGFPEHIATNVPVLDLIQKTPLTFETPDMERFPALRLARESLKNGDSYPCVLNAANEIAVAAFLNQKISFLGISQLVEKVLNTHNATSFQTLEDVLETDAWARRKAETFL